MSSEIIELSLFPYSKLYIEMSRDLSLIEIAEQYVESYEHFSGSDISNSYFSERGCLYILEDAADAASNFIAKTVIWIKKIWRRFIGIFTSAKQKIADADKKYKEGFSKEEGEESVGTVEETIRRMVKKDHQWTSKEIEDFINSNQSEGIAYWAKLKLNVKDPDVENLKFFSGVNKEYRLAFQNLLTFMLFHEKNANVRLSDLGVEGRNTGGLSNLLKGGSKKVLIASGGLLALSHIPGLVDKVSLAIERSDPESVEAIYSEVEKGVGELNTAITETRATDLKETSKQRLEEISKRINDLQVHLAAHPDESKQVKRELNQLSREAQRIRNKAHGKTGSKLLDSSSLTKISKVLGILGLTVSAGLGVASAASNLASSVANGAMNSLRSVIK